MKPALTRVFGSAPTQHHPIPTGTEITDDLTHRCRLNNTPWGINRSYRNAISDSNRFRQHSQVCFREEIPLCEVRAPNKVPHTKQDTTHFLPLMATQSKLMVNSSPCVGDPRITSLVNWNT